MILNEATAIKVNSLEEAAQLYERIYEAYGAGELDEMVKKHLASIPPRKRRT